MISFHQHGSTQTPPNGRHTTAFSSGSSLLAGKVIDQFTPGSKRATGKTRIDQGQRSFQCDLGDSFELLLPLFVDDLFSCITLVPSCTPPPPNSIKLAVIYKSTLAFFPSRSDLFRPFRSIRSESYQIEVRPGVGLPLPPEAGGGSPLGS